jgi:hypothetical protein
MFYGGKLLAHLTAEDEADAAAAEEEVRDFINLRCLNRHVSVVMDSDRDSSKDAIRSAKQRLVDEISKHGGHAWVTEGREIENYLDPEALRDVVEALYPGRGDRVRKGRFEKALPKVRDEKKSSSVDKVLVAERMCEKATDFTRLDLKHQVDGLVAFIRQSNGIL